MIMINDDRRDPSVTKISPVSQMPKLANSKKSDKKQSKKELPVKQEKPSKEIKVKHAPPVSSKDIIAKAKANVWLICLFLCFPINKFPLHRSQNP
jgi:hypothetical protein